MTNAGLPPRRGAHRARRGVLGGVVPSVTAVVLVLAVVGLLYLVLGQRDTSDSAAAGPTSTGTASATTTEPSPTPATSSPAVTPTPSTTSPAAEPPTTPEPATTSAEPTTAAPRPAVVVLNETRRSGLAARTADRLRRAGWVVAGTGNFRGNLASTTVYYPAGEQAAARLLAADLPGPDRIRPVFGNLSRSRLTVILAADYPG